MDSGIDTPLMWSAQGGEDDRLTLEHVDVARYLLSRGASIDKADESGYTALLIACYCGFGTVTEMVELLLSAGANPNARNSKGRIGSLMNHSGPPSEPSPPAFDGTDHSRGICASRTARCWRFEGSRCGDTLPRGGRVAREGLSNGRRPSPSSRATATTASSGTCSRSGARPSKKTYVSH